jgi:tetratricopeptide (TPR) repeat protein
MRVFLFFAVFMISTALAASDEPVRSKNLLPLAHCGEMYAPPFANSNDAGPRKCPVASERQYKVRHRGIGFEILDSESEACFVPDQEYKTLDEIVDAVQQRVKFDPSIKEQSARLEQARLISKTISDVMAERGFALYIPTETLGDALLDRSGTQGPEKHVFDCDTGSFIFLTVAEVLGAPVALVDITLPSGAGHNYVRWDFDSKNSMDWDMNGRSECVTPTGLPSYQGRSMSLLETLGYAYSLRAELWKNAGKYDRALMDFRQGMKLYSQGPISYNNFAWMIATRDIPDRKKLQVEAVSAAERAVAIDRTANYLDTLGCTYALGGDFDRASSIESEAVTKSHGKTEFQQNLDKFKAHKDCTGEE